VYLSTGLEVDMKRAGLFRILSAALSAGGVLWLGYVVNAQTTATKPAQASSASAEAPRFLNVNVVRVKPELLTEWQDFQTKEVMPTLKKGGVMQRDAWQTSIGEAYEYAFVSPAENLGVRDSPSPIVKALGEEGARAYGVKSRRLIASAHSYVVRTRPDLSYPPTSSGPPKLAVLSAVSIAPGRILDYENYLRTEVLPLQTKGQSRGYLVSQTVFGGDGNEFVTLALMDTFGELDKGPLATRVLGADGAAKLAAKTAGIIAHVERSVLRYSPDLSFTVASSSTTK
jgi:hypothetical protein